MRKPGVNPNDVQMSDVLCDFCLAEWRADVPFLEGHQGSCICGPCLTEAWRELVVGERDPVTAEFTCPMCREKREDRAALGRAEEPGWRSPKGHHAVCCSRCLGLAAAALEKDPDFGWRRPTN
jgi:hypothetical protein